jgi:hypothetical protein
MRNLEQRRFMVAKQLIVKTTPRRSAEATVTQEGGVLRARNADVVAPSPRTWNPFQELEGGESRPRLTHPSMGELDLDAIPDGMEGHYFH